MIDCPHGCNVQLIKKHGAREGVLECPACKCVFGVVVIRATEKCLTRRFGKIESPKKIGKK